MAAGPKKQKHELRRRRRRSPLVTWGIVMTGLALGGYAFSQASCVPYSDRDIKVVDFSGLTRAEKNDALKAANDARCTCGCGLTLAQCVSTDLTCPIREGNIQRIVRLVEQVRGTKGS